MEIAVLVGRANEDKLGRDSHTPKDAGKSTHVYFRIPYKTYERLPLLGHDHLVRVQVKGQINRVDGRGIELTNATMDLVK